MAAERDLERRVADALHGWLDAEPAPHPRWEDAPARTGKAGATGITGPVKLLAVAAFVAVAAGGVLWAGGLLRGDEPQAVATTWCVPIEAYPPAGTLAPRPTAAPWPQDPGATPTTGVLQPGETAMLGDADGPGAQVRVSDARVCDRYPTYRPRQPGTRFVVARVEVRMLRDGFLPQWVSAGNHLGVRIGDDVGPSGQEELVFGVPGVGGSSSLESPAGFEWVSDVVWSIPDGPAAELVLEWRADGDRIDQPPLVAWAIGSRPEAPPFVSEDVFPDLSGPAATGRVPLDQWAVVDQGEDRYGVRVGQLDEVERYPAAAPALGSFVEVMISYALAGSGDEPVLGPHEWRAVDGNGRVLDLLAVPEDVATGVLNPLFTDAAVTGGGWLAIDAPPAGGITLEYRPNGEGTALFEVPVRDGPAVPSMTAVPSPSVPATEAPSPSLEAFVSDATLCATLDDYGDAARPTPAPTIGPMPSIAPDAPPTTGMLQLGDVAILGDEDGPAARLRVSDLRICDRYPTARPMYAGMRFVVVRMELLVDRSGYFPYWIHGAHVLWLRREDDDQPHDRHQLLFGVPGVTRQSSLAVGAGFEAVTDLVYAVPGGEATRLFLDYRPDGENSLLEPVTLSWDLGVLPAAPVVEWWPTFPWLFAVPDGPATTGRIAADEVAIVEQAGIRFGARAGRVDEVERYPGLEPARGRFVEVEIAYGAAPEEDTIPGVGLHEWRAVTGAGEELEIHRLRDSGPEQHILEPHTAGRTEGSWMLIDAPPTGEIVLEYRRGGEGPVLFEVLVRGA